jgi:integrase
MNRRRAAKNKSFPDNLYQNPDGYYYYRNPGNKKKKGLGHDKAHAFAEARAANKVLATVTKSDLAKWVSGSDQISFKDWLPTYMQLWQEHKKLAPGTVTAAKQTIKRFEAAEFAWMPISAISTVQVAEYLDGIKKNNGPGQAMNMRARLMDVFAYAETKGHIETGKNPVTATLTPNYKVQRDRLSLEQYLTIREEADGWLRDAMDLALLTAQRVHDIAEMKFSDLEDGYLLVTQGKGQGAVKLKLDVNIRLDEIGMSIGDAIKQCRNKTVSKYLVHHLQSGGTYKAGGAVFKRGISSAFSALRDEVGIKPAAGKTAPTFHEIRSLAERLYRKQYGKEFAQAMLGHKTETMTAKYDDLRGGWQTVSVK